MNTHTRFTLLGLSLPFISLLSSCHSHKDTQDNYVSQYVKNVDATAQVLKNDPNMLPDDSYQITSNLRIPLSSPYNCIVTADRKTVFSGFPATTPQLVSISKDGTIISSVDPAEPLNNRENYVIFTPTYIYVDNQSTGKHTKVDRTPAMPSTWSEA